MMRNLYYLGLSAIASLGMGLPAVALPPPEDVPEEVLRTQIILEARSPVDGKPLAAAEYAELQAQLQTSQYPPQVDPSFQQIIFLLRVRQLLRPLLPN